MHKPRENIWISKLHESYVHTCTTLAHYWAQPSQQLDETHENCNWKNKLIKLPLFICVVFSFSVVSLRVRFWCKDNSQNCAMGSHIAAALRGYYRAYITAVCSWDTQRSTLFVSEHSKISVSTEGWFELQTCTKGRCVCVSTSISKLWKYTRQKIM
jgi:hypothetical protein